MKDDDAGDMHLINLKVFEAKTEEDALNLLFLGNMNRITSSTPMNEASSRSHCIFTMTIEGRHRESERVRLSKLHLVSPARLTLRRGPEGSPPPPPSLPVWSRAGGPRWQ